MQTVKRACRPRTGAFDPTRRDTVLDLTARLATAAWYLLITKEGRLHLRNVQNLVARVTTAGAYLRDQATKELKERLTEMFKPTEGSCYQRVLPLPAVDEVVSSDAVPSPIRRQDVHQRPEHRRPGN